MYDMTNTLDRINGRLHTEELEDTTVEISNQKQTITISELEAITIETIQMKHSKKKINKNEKSINELWDNSR